MTKKQQLIFQPSLFEPVPLMVVARNIPADSLHTALLYAVFTQSPALVPAGETPPELVDLSRWGLVYVRNNGGGEAVLQWCCSGNGYRSLRDSGFLDVPFWCHQRRGWYQE